jgi:hypothetical protein
MPERALEDWVGKYVSMWAVVASGVTQYQGRVVSVGSDGIVFQRLRSPQHTQKLPAQQFFPWHSIRFIQLVDEQAPGDEG